MSANNESTGSNVAEFCDFFVSPPEVLTNSVGESDSSVNEKGEREPGNPLEPMYLNREEVFERDMFENRQPGNPLEPMYLNREHVFERDMFENQQPGNPLEPMYLNREEVFERDMFENRQPGNPLEPLYLNREHVFERDMFENQQQEYPHDPIYLNREEVFERDMFENQQVCMTLVEAPGQVRLPAHTLRKVQLLHVLPEEISLYDEAQNHYSAPYFPQPYSNGKLKPPLGFAGLCVLVLSTVEEASVAEMYAIVMDFFPYFEAANRHWKHSLRHELSKHAKHGEHEEPIFFKTSEKNGRWKFVPAKSSVERKLENILKSREAEIMNSMRDTQQWNHLFNCFFTRCESSV